MKVSKNIVLAFFAISLGLFGFVAKQEVDYAEFVKKHATYWGLKGTQCGDYTPDSYTVVLKNTSKDLLDIKIAVQEKSKKWRCFNHESVAFNDTIIGYACTGNGKYLKWVKKAGDRTTVFPTDQEVNDQYAK